MRPSSPNCSLERPLCPGATDALIGRVVRLRLAGELDEVLNALWDACFVLLEGAEAAVESGAARLSADEVLAQGTRLLAVLGVADELSVALASLCAVVPAGDR